MKDLFDSWKKIVLGCIMLFSLPSYTFSQTEYIFGFDPILFLKSYIDSVDYLFNQKSDTTFVKNSVEINYRFKPNNRLVKIKYMDSFLTIKLKKNKLYYIEETPCVDYKHGFIFSFKKKRKKLILFKVLVLSYENKCLVVKNGKTQNILECFGTRDTEKIKKYLFNLFCRFKKIITNEECICTSTFYTIQ